MKNTLKIDFNGKKIVMDRTFAKNCTNTNSDEYAQLQSVRRDYPDFTVVTKTIKRNPEKETYKGLTYEYMEKYISSHDEDGKIMAEYQDLRGLSERAKEALAEPCSYLEMRAWFLNTYPAIAKFHEDREKLLAA